MVVSLEVNEPSMMEDEQDLVCYSLRISNRTDQENEYILFFKKWFKEKLGLTIKYSSAGIHNDTKVPHFHYHILCNEPAGFNTHVSHSGTQGFRNFRKLKSNTEEIELPKGNLMKVSRKPKQDLKRPLLYPLKCGIPLPIGCYNLDVKKFMVEAQQLLEESVTRNHKQKVKELKDKCLEYLDSQRDYIESRIETREVPDYVMDTQVGYKTIIHTRIEAYSLAIELSREFYIKEDPDCSPNTAGCVAMRWLNSRGILSNRDYIRMYSPISRLM